MIENKVVNGLSVGFIIKAAKISKNLGRIITKGKLIEISLVKSPANHKAKIDFKKKVRI